MSQLYEKLRALITTVDELRDAGLQKFISLPRIAAIGTQSSGKSSLIESIVGMDFLPRGGGVVTRRPLELRLVHLSTQDHKEDAAWAVFGRDPDKKITDFNAVRREIERQTDEVAGANKGIINDPILLTVYATGAPDLTLIDLPGITRVPIRGSDQVEDIEKVTRDMTNFYINDPRTIILAVLPANQDMSVSDSLQLARAADPKGLRTIGVITKIDIMDQGTDAVKMLRGEDVPLRLGYVGVKMRSQQDITQNKPVKDALQDERAWFEGHRVYNKMPPGLVGTHVLIEKLTNVLIKHIRRFLPDIKNEIGDKRRSVQHRLEELGDGVPLGATERVQMLWALVTDFCAMFKNTIRGNHFGKLSKYMAALPSGISYETLMSGGVRIRAILNDFLYEMSANRVTKQLSDDDIGDAIAQHEGDSLPGLGSPDIFEFLIRPHLARITAPACDCVEDIAQVLNGLVERMCQVVFRRFPKLGEIVLNMTLEIISRERLATRTIVEQQVACQTGYLWTNDLDYLTKHGGGADEGAPQEPPPEPGRMERAKAGAQNYMQSYGNQQKRRGQMYQGPFVQETRRRLDGYFGLVVWNVRDSVPKMIGFYLVRRVQDCLQFELLQALKNSDQIAMLLGEPPHIMEERKQLSEQLAVLQKATGVLTRDPSLAGITVDLDDDYDEPEGVRGKAAAAVSKVGASVGASAGQAASAVGRGVTGAAKSVAGVFSAKPAAAAQQPAAAAGGYPAQQPPSPGAASFAQNPAVQSAAGKAMQDPAVQAAAMRAAQNPAVQQAGMKAMQDPGLQKAAMGAASGAAKSAASLFGAPSGGGVKKSALFDD